jgi:DNA-binding IclR family transcriptional regulator
VTTQITSEPRNPIRKALSILRYMIEAPDDTGVYGVREIGSALGLAPSTVHRSLRSLLEEGLVEEDEEGGGYRVGLGFMRLAFEATRRYPMWRHALSALRRLESETSETVLLGVYDPLRMQMMVAAAVESSSPVRYVVDLSGRWVPLHAGASGQAILAFLAPDERERVLAAHPPERLTESTITDRDELERELAVVRERGYAVSRGQRLVGAAAIAAPVLGPDGRVIGDVVLTMPEYRLTDERVESFHELVVACARSISEELAGGS